MTQKEFAEQLFVTESAVSKWERGMSYPDITLLQNICSVLDISEYELLNGGEDTKRRNAEKLAEKYLHLTRNYRIAQYIAYGLALLGCAIGNIASGHTLDWFFIVLTSVMAAASLTLAPALAAAHPKTERYKAPLTFGAFTVSLELLLLACCVYTSGDWFLVAAAAVLFGMTLVFLPFLLPKFPLPACLEGRKASAYCITETVLLLLLLLVCSLYVNGDWFGITAVSVVFGLSLFFTPVLLKQLPLPEWMEGKKASCYLVLETALLLVLLSVACLYVGGDWFLLAAVSVIFGLGFALCPVILHQTLRGRPLYHHKTLLYFGIQTILLFVLLAVADFYTSSGVLFQLSVPIALLCLLLPWGILLATRYLPVSGWFRAASCSAWTGLWIWLAPFFLDKILASFYGPTTNPYSLQIPFDFTLWRGGQITYNVLAIILFSLLLLAVAFAVTGAVSLWRRKRTR